MSYISEYLLQFIVLLHCVCECMPDFKTPEPARRPGVPMYIIPDNVIYDPVLLCRFLADNEITRVLFTPSLLEAVLDTKGAALQDSMRSMRWVCRQGAHLVAALCKGW